MNTLDGTFSRCNIFSGDERVNKSFSYIATQGSGVALLMCYEYPETPSDSISQGTEDKGGAESCMRAQRCRIQPIRSATIIEKHSVKCTTVVLELQGGLIAGHITEYA
jgi:hypothetical protein